MSNHAAIAAVTRMLMTIIQDAVAAEDGPVAGAKITAKPPDRARIGTTDNQVNLFLYRVAIDAAWRNQDPPAIRPGESGQPPLPLVLSYLITAYGESDEDLLSHQLLGIAMGVLNDRPLLSRKRIAGLNTGSDLDTQFERIRITPDPRPQDELSRMWSTFGTGYRLSVCYDAAVVLIDSERDVAAAVPVLMRGRDDRGPASIAGLPPRIDRVRTPHPQAGARPGDLVTLEGSNLGAVTEVRMTGLRLEQPVALEMQTVAPTAITVRIPPSSSDAPPPGTVAVAAMYDAGAGEPIPSLPAPLALAPTIVSKAALKAKLDAGGNATLKVKCAPPVRAGQTVALIVGDRIVHGPAATATSTELTFALERFEKKTYTLRLRIDGVDSVPVAEPGESAGGAAPLPLDKAQTVVLS